MRIEHVAHLWKICHCSIQIGNIVCAASTVASSSSSAAINFLFIKCLCAFRTVNYSVFTNSHTNIVFFLPFSLARRCGGCDGGCDVVKDDISVVRCGTIIPSSEKGKRETANCDMEFITEDVCSALFRNSRGRWRWRWPRWWRKYFLIILLS